MKIKKEELTKKLLEMDCFKEKTIEYLDKNGCEVSVDETIEFIRQVNKSKSHTVHGHAVVKNLCLIDYENSDYIGIDWDNSIIINGNTIHLNNANRIIIYISHGDWYDIHVYNEHGHVTLCLKPKK